MGWQTINGQRLYFDQNGLHTAHTAVADPAEAATCTRAGKTAGSHCSVCGEVITARQTIPAAGHKAVTVKGRAATCTAAGLTDGSKCANCGITLTAQRSIPARGHTPVTVKGHAAGYTYTGLTDGKKCSTCGAWITAQKTIPKVYIRYIDIADLKNGTVTLAVGEKAALSLSFERRYGVSTQYFTYTPKKVQFVDNNELSIITGVAEGKGKITVYTDNRKVKAKLTIQVVDPCKPAGISINQGKTVTLTMGQRLRLGTTLSPASARATLTWKSSKPKVAIVDASGNVVPVGEGKAKITVTTHNKKKATITVVVVDPYKPLGISINQGKMVTLKAGQTLRLGVTLNPVSARSALTWKSSKPAVATVDGSGLVRAVKKGKAKITVTTYNKKKATFTVVVTE